MTVDVYDDSLRAEVAGILAEVETELIADGLMFRDLPVALVTRSTTNADDATGNPGTVTETRTYISPRPKVEVKTQRRWVDGVPVQIGDAKLYIRRDAVSRDAIMGASVIEVGAVKYQLVDGELAESPLEWRVVLKRASP